MRKLLTALLLWCAGGAYAQQAVVDSLRTKLAQSTSDSSRVNLLNLIAEQYTKFNPKKAVETSNEAFSLASKINFLKGKANALSNRGVAYLILSEYGNAMQAHQQALKIREQIKDSVGVVSSYVNLGNVYFRNSEMDKALTTYEQGVTYALQIKDRKGLSRFYNNIGSIYKGQEDYPKALEFYRKAAALKEELNDRRGLAVSLQHLGAVSAETGAIPQALAYMNRSIKIFRELQDLTGELSVLRDISDVHRHQKAYAQALAASKKSLELARQINSTLDVALSAEQVHELYALQGKYPEAYENLLTRAYATDTLHSNRRRAMVAEAEARYETDKKELENQKLLAKQAQHEKELAQQANMQLLSRVALGATLALVLVLFLSWLKVQSRNKRLKEINGRVESQNAEITAQKSAIEAQNQTMKAQRDELEKLNAFKNKLFSIISHDLRSPFASVQALFYLADANAMTDQEFKRLFKMLGKDYDNATNLLDNLLVWAKSQMEGTNIQYAQLNLQELAEESFRQTRHQAEAKEIQLVNDVPPHLQLTSDHERLNFVIRNLVMNAIKFTKPLGQIRISAAEFNQEIVVTVKDTGEGMPPQMIEKLFTDNRFSTSGTSNEKGTGLGLMLCKELLEDIDAKISVESEEGVGSTFYLWLPKLMVQSAEAQTVATVG